VRFLLLLSFVFYSFKDSYMKTDIELHPTKTDTISLCSPRPESSCSDSGASRQKDGAVDVEGSSSVQDSTLGRVVNGDDANTTFNSTTETATSNSESRRNGSDSTKNLSSIKKYTRKIFVGGLPSDGKYIY